MVPSYYAQAICGPNRASTTSPVMVTVLTTLLTTGLLVAGPTAPVIAKDHTRVKMIQVAQSDQRRPKQSRAEPESQSKRSERQIVTSKKSMVATANAHATRGALKILRQGGNAIDATITAQMILTLVEPQSSGIGGGAFLLVYDAENQQLKTYDGREAAPLTISENHFLKKNNKPFSFFESLHSGLSIGVPGVLAALKKSHQIHGKLLWRDLFQPAIDLAREGFAVSPRLNQLLTRLGPERFNKEARRLYFDDFGTARPVGYLLKNPALAATLEDISENGIAAFYTGPRAQKIIQTAKLAPLTPSEIQLSDLTSYQAKERQPICFTYRQHKICSMAQPSSGGLTVAMTLKLLEPFDLGKQPLNARALHLICEAERLAFSDRNRFMADPDFVPQPEGFLDESYLKMRRSLINEKATNSQVKAGNPPLYNKSRFGLDHSREQDGTSHISIQDEAGNVVSMTTTIATAFGSGQMVDGFLLNSELTDFSFRPKDSKGRPIANRPEGGKRPRSSMAPTIAFDETNTPTIILGSPGGSRIILYVIKALIAHIDWRLDPQQAVSLINFGCRENKFEIEAHPGADQIIKQMHTYGHKIRKSSMTSGSQMIIRSTDGLKGGTDPRREGLVSGD